MDEKELLQAIYNDLKEVKEKVNAIETDVSTIKMTIENEIRVNIQRVAEGHLDLSRNWFQKGKGGAACSALFWCARLLLFFASSSK